MKKELKGYKRSSHSILDLNHIFFGTVSAREECFLFFLNILVKQSALNLSGFTKGNIVHMYQII